MAKPRKRLSLLMWILIVVGVLALIAVVWVMLLPRDQAATPAATGGKAPAPAARECCKHCGENSKPCGDSCISKDKTCNKVGGCACP